MAALGKCYQAWRPRVAALLLAYFCLQRVGLALPADAWRVLTDEGYRVRLEREGIDSAYERRFSELRAHLPARGELGYLCAVASDSILTDGQAVYDYYRSQYALAPLRLRIDLEPRLVLSQVGVPPSGDWALVAGQADGVALLRRAAP